MNEKEMRELDAWIGIHIFELHEFEPTPDRLDICAYCSHHAGFSEHFNKAWVEISNQLPHYTTDPAAAMLVLEKCAAVDTLVITNSKVAEHPWVIVGRKTCHRSCKPTLPLAICAFAKQLFHAQEKETKVHSR